MKTDAHFKLTKTTKRILATIQDKNLRSQYKSLMINAENTFEINKKRKQSKNED